ncbi:MAG: hypothetical protein HYX24_07415 [Candidatus Aenigmarchaeota archaeon]|nr:hypothetical protein [Candidatus Aenigmarchaeota archaeon]
MPELGLVMDELKEWAKDQKRVIGKAVIASPFEMEMFLDYTTQRGGGSNIYYSMAYQFHKWDMHAKKVEEWMEVAPSFEYYNLTIEQKHKIEQTIKQGLGQAAQAVSDYELVAHDARRYKEMLDYFSEAKKNADEHVLRSLFVDRVDAFTGEGFTMMSMVKRWPTIITDFVRMKGSWDDIGTIMKELDVTQAEATVLRTKNKLFKEWQVMFLPELKGRYMRIQTLANARKKSIDEYRKWLKPYVARFRMLKEGLDKPAGLVPDFTQDVTYVPGMGQGNAYLGVKLWVWKPLRIPEFHKAEARMEAEGGYIIDPYDDFVKKWKKKIEERYNVPITDKDVREILKKRKGFAHPIRPGLEFSSDALYYSFFDIDFLLALIKTPPPKGTETDNPMFMVKGWMISQNVLLLHMLELHAKEKALERYINELIGTREAEEDVEKTIEELFPKEAEPEKFWEKLTLARQRKQLGEKMEKHGEKASERFKWLYDGLDSFVHLFIKYGPYEPVFEERMSKEFTRDVGYEYDKIIARILNGMKVPT